MHYAWLLNGQLPVTSPCMGPNSFVQFGGLGEGGVPPVVLLKQLTEWEGRVSVAMEGISSLQEEATKEAMSRSTVHH